MVSEEELLSESMVIVDARAHVQRLEISLKFGKFLRCST
jgi:hypothetical protein